MITVLHRGGYAQMITILHRGGYAQMITILHRGGSLGTPKSDYLICARPLICFPVCSLNQKHSRLSFQVIMKAVGKYVT